MRVKTLSLLKVYEEEISLLLWTTALLFIIRSAGIILNNYAETAFLKRYGVEYLPVVNMLNAVATSFIIGRSRFLWERSLAPGCFPIFLFFQASASP